MNGSGHVITEAEKTGGTPGAPEARRGRKEPPLGSLEQHPAIALIWVQGQWISDFWPPRL